MFCSFPKKFHPCFCFSQFPLFPQCPLLYSKVGIADVLCICSLVYFRSVQGFSTCLMIPIIHKNSGNLYITLFSLHVTASQAIVQVCLFCCFFFLLITLSLQMVSLPLNDTVLVHWLKLLMRVLYASLYTYVYSKVSDFALIIRYLKKKRFYLFVAICIPFMLFTKHSGCI